MPEKSVSCNIRRAFKPARTWVRRCLPWMLLALAAAEADTLTVSSFLETANRDERLKVQKEKCSYVEAARGNPLMLDKAEIRVRNTGLEINHNRYDLILSPSGLLEAKASGRYLEALRGYNRHARELALNKLLKERYTLALKLIFAQRELAIHRQLKVLSDDRITVLSKSMNRGEFEIMELIDAREELAARLIDIVELENEIRDLVENIQVHLGPRERVEFDTTNIIGADSIVAYLKTCAFSLDSSNLHLANSRLKFEQARERYRYESVQNRNVLSRIELSYDNGKLYDELQRKYDGKLSYDTRKAYAMTLGFNIPWVSGDRMSAHQRKLGYLADSCDYAELTVELRNHMNRMAADVQTLTQEYAILEEKQASFNTESALRTYLGVEGIDPIILLRTRESILKSELAMLKIRGRIFHKYIELLDNEGVLSKEPLRNYLSATREPLSP
jgi:hypothetical protein